MTDALVITGIAAGYGARPVISDITMHIAPGETFGLIGLNGAGKTTLLKTVLGLKDPSQGAILVDGHKAGSAGARRALSFLPERFDPAWFLNAYEFIDFTSSLYGHKTPRADVDAMAERLGLNRDFLSKRASTYSKGMRQKLGLMAAFLCDCALYVLDEPMSGLDPLARLQVKDVIGDMKARGKTLFLSSHILSDMEELCDRIAVMHKGTLHFVGQPSALLKKSDSPTLERAFLHAIIEKDAVAA